ncbi:hypothetical protein, conserved in T. vivax, (fragment), partial [Trypanosoma vivax Y486]
EAQDGWASQTENTARQAANAKNLTLGATMVYLCRGVAGKNPCFAKGQVPEELKTDLEVGGEIAPQKVEEVWPKAKQELCKAKRTDRNVRRTIGRFWARVQSRGNGENAHPTFGECERYAGHNSDKGCLEYGAENTTDVFWMKTLLDAEDALLEAEHALAAANRTLEAVTRLTERVHDRHETLVAALRRENGAQARDDGQAPQNAGASDETATKGDAQRDSGATGRKETPGEESNADTQSSTNSAHFGWLGVKLAAGMTTFAGRHDNH